MADIALAHAPDDASLAQDVSAALRTAGHAVSTSARDADVVIFLYSQATARSAQLTSFLETAARGDRPILPVLISDASPTGAYEYFVAGCVPVRWSGGDVADLQERICRAVHHVLRDEETRRRSARAFDRERARRDFETRAKFDSKVHVGLQERLVVVWMWLSVVASVWAVLAAPAFLVITPWGSYDPSGPIPAYLSTMRAELAYVAAAGYGVNAVVRLATVLAFAFWLYVSYRNLRVLSPDKGPYRPVLTAVRVLLPYFPPWVGYRVWRHLLLANDDPLPPVHARAIVAWTALWPVAGFIGGLFEWQVARLSPLGIAFLTMLTNGLWIAVGLLSIVLIKASGRVQRLGWAHTQMRASLASASAKGEVDVLVAYAPEDVTLAHACIWRLEQNGIRCWQPAPEDSASRPIPADVRGLALFWAKGAAACPGVSSLPRWSLESGLTTVVVDVDGTAASEPLLEDLHWRHWLSIDISRAEDVDVLAGALRLLATPRHADAVETMRVRRALDARGEPQGTARPEFVVRGVLHYVSAAALAFCALLAVRLIIECWAVLGRPTDVAFAVVRSRLLAIDLARWVIGLMAIAPFAIWWVVLRRDVTALRRGHSARPRPRLSRLRIPGLMWATVGLAGLGAIVVSQLTAGAVLEVVSAAAFVGLCLAGFWTMRDHEAWLETEVDVIFGSARGARFHTSSNGVTTLRTQSGAVAIAACLGTLFLIASASAHNDIPLAIRFDPETNRVHSVFPSPQTDAAQWQGFSTEVLATASLTLVCGVWVYAAWSNLASLRNCRGITPLTASIRVALPVVNLFSAGPVLSQLWHTSADDHGAALRTPWLVRLWWLLTGTAMFAWITAVVMRHDESYWIASAIFAGSSIAAAWLFTYFAYTVRGQQVEQFLDLEAHRYERMAKRA